MAITYNAELKRFDAPWGWMRFNFETGDVQVCGPTPDAWFNAEAAVKTASLFSGYCETLGMALALAIHQQYAAFRGGQILVA